MEIIGLESGIEDLQRGIQFVLNNYNDDTEKFIQQMGNKFIKSAKEKTPNGTQKKSKNKKLINNYTKSAVQGWTSDKSIEIRNKAPHYHLIERGHEIYDKNKNPTGKRTPPKYMVKRTILEIDAEYPEAVKKFIEQTREKAEKEMKK